MQHEKAGEPFHWTNKLDQLSALPGEPPAGKAVAWQKLHDRLQKKPHRKKVVVYRAVAACLLLAAGIWWLTWEQNAGPIKTKVQEVHTSVAARQIQPTDKKDEVIVSVQVSTAKKTASPAEPENKPRHSALIGSTPHAPDAQDAATAREFTLQTIVQASPPVDTGVIAAAVPVRKKLRMVHINELGYADQETQIAGNTPAPSAQSRPDQADLVNFSVSRNASDNILKIKLSSN